MQPRRAYYTHGPKDCPLKCYHITNSPKKDDYLVKHWHSQMHVFFVKQGALQFYSLAGEHEIHAGQIYLVMPEEIHSHHTLVDGSEYLDLIFSPELVTVPENHFFFENFLRPLREAKLEIPRVIDNSSPGYEKILAQLRTIMDADEEAADYKSTVFLGAVGLCLALMSLSRVMKEGEHNPLTGVRGDNVVHVCHSYIASHYKEKITLGQLADLVHMHPNYLCSLFKAYTGQTIFEYLTSIRVSFATQRIRNSPQPLRKIAEECGFNSMSFFNKKFKLHTGLTPYAYSKLYKNR